MQESSLSRVNYRDGFEGMSHPWDGKSEGGIFANALHQGESCGINFKSF